MFALQYTDERQYQKFFIRSVSFIPQILKKRESGETCGLARVRDQKAMQYVTQHFCRTILLEYTRGIITGKARISWRRSAEKEQSPQLINIERCNNFPTSPSQRRDWLRCRPNCCQRTRKYESTKKSEWLSRFVVLRLIA